MSNDDGRVSVCLRVRPMLDFEKSAGYRAIVTYPQPNTIVIGNERSFTFDHVKSETAPQQELYNDCAKPLLNYFLQGYNSTIIAYGQTGSGKTYTMGTVSPTGVSIADYGIVPRMMYDMFNHLSEHPEIDAEIKVSFLEIYNEEIQDLLLDPIPTDTNSNDPNNTNNNNSNNSSNNTNSTSGNNNTNNTNNSGNSNNINNTQYVRPPAPTIRENPDGGIIVTGAVEETVTSVEEMLACMQKGTASRSVGATLMNSQSSRSHAIFSIHLTMRPKSTTTSTTANAADPNSAANTNAAEDANTVNALCNTIRCKLNFVDLAGSERLKRTGAIGERMKEGISINCGLLALGNVISALSESAKGGKRSHVPFRDSKITRMLQDSLGGNSKTLMIACISGSDANEEESLNTAKYASRAANIRNKPVINTDAIGARINALTLQTKVFGERVVVLEAMLRSHGIEPPPPIDISQLNNPTPGIGIATGTTGSHNNNNIHTSNLAINISSASRSTFAPFSPSDRPLPTLLNKNAYGNAFGGGMSHHQDSSLSSSSRHGLSSLANAFPSAGTGHAGSTTASSINSLMLPGDQSNYSSSVVQSTHGIVASNKLNRTMKNICMIAETIRTCPYNVHLQQVQQYSEMMANPGMEGMKIPVPASEPPECTCGVCTTTEPNAKLVSIMEELINIASEEEEKAQPTKDTHNSNGNSNTNSTSTGATKWIDLHVDPVKMKFTELPHCGMCEYYKERVEVKDVALQEAIRVIKSLTKPKKEQKNSDASEDADGEEVDADGDGDDGDMNDTMDQTQDHDQEQEQEQVTNKPSESEPQVQPQQPQEGSCDADDPSAPHNTSTTDATTTPMQSTSDANPEEEQKDSTDDSTNTTDTNTEDTITTTGASEKASDKNSDEHDAASQNEEIENVLYECGVKHSLDSPVHTVQTIFLLTKLAQKHQLHDLIELEEHLDLEIVGKEELLRLLQSSKEESEMERYKLEQQILDMRREIEATEAEKNSVVKQLETVNERAEAARVSKAYQERLKTLQNRLRIVERQAREAETFRIKYMNDEAKIRVLEHEVTNAKKEKLRVLKELKKKKEEFKHLSYEQKKELNTILREKKKLHVMLTKLQKEKQAHANYTQRKRKQTVINMGYSYGSNDKLHSHAGSGGGHGGHGSSGTGHASHGNAHSASSSSSLVYGTVSHVHVKPQLNVSSDIVDHFQGVISNGIQLSQLYMEMKSIVREMNQIEEHLRPLEIAYAECDDNDMFALEKLIDARQSYLKSCKERLYELNNIALSISSSNPYINDILDNELLVKSMHCDADEPNIQHILEYHTRIQKKTQEKQKQRKTLSNMVEVLEMETKSNGKNATDQTIQGLIREMEQSNTKKSGTSGTSGTNPEQDHKQDVTSGGSDENDDEDEENMNVVSNQSALSQMAFTLRRYNNLWWLQSLASIIDTIFNKFNTSYSECIECTKTVCKDICYILINELSISQLSAVQCIDVMRSQVLQRDMELQEYEAKIDKYISKSAQLEEKIQTLRTNEHKLQMTLQSSIERERKLREDTRAERNSQSLYNVNNTDTECPYCGAHRKRYMLDTESTKMRTLQTQQQRTLAAAAAANANANAANEPPFVTNTNPHHAKMPSLGTISSVEAAFSKPVTRQTSKSIHVDHTSHTSRLYRTASASVSPKNTPASPPRLTKISQDDSHLPPSSSTGATNTAATNTGVGVGGATSGSNNNSTSTSTSTNSTSMLPTANLNLPPLAAYEGDDTLCSLPDTEGGLFYTPTAAGGGGGGGGAGVTGLTRDKSSISTATASGFPQVYGLSLDHLPETMTQFEHLQDDVDAANNNTNVNVDLNPTIASAPCPKALTETDVIIPRASTSNTTYNTKLTTTQRSHHDRPSRRSVLGSNTHNTNTDTASTTGGGGGGSIHDRLFTQTTRSSLQRVRATANSSNLNHHNTTNDGHTTATYAGSTHGGGGGGGHYSSTPSLSGLGGNTGSNTNMYEKTKPMSTTNKDKKRGISTSSNASYILPPKKSVQNINTTIVSQSASTSGGGGGGGASNTATLPINPNTAPMAAAFGIVPLTTGTTGTTSSSSLSKNTAAGAGTGTTTKTHTQIPPVIIDPNTIVHVDDTTIPPPPPDTPATSVANVPIQVVQDPASLLLTSTTNTTTTTTATAATTTTQPQVQPQLTSFKITPGTRLHIHNPAATVPVTQDEESGIIPPSPPPSQG